MQSNQNTIHIIGIGGSGMLPLAELLLKQGHSVSGSDRLLNQQTLETLSPPIRKRLERLINLGATIVPQDGSGITNNTIRVVISTAIESSNPDIQAAQRLSIPVLHRSEELKNAVDQDYLLGICGTSGKSTSAALCAWLLMALHDLDVFVGGAEILDQRPDGIGWTAVHTGKGRWSVLELDESDKSLLRFTPRHALILNITRDHHPLEENIDIFKTFTEQVSGKLVLNQKDEGCRMLAQQLSPDKVVWFSPPEKNEWITTKTGIQISFHGQMLDIPLMGRHNGENAAGLLTLLEQALPAYDKAIIKSALNTFPGIRRRMQRYGSSIPVFDDYAHNPEKIAAAMQAIQERYSRVHFIFQPHGYGPLRFHLEDFANVFRELIRPADSLIFLPVFDAGGTTDRSVSSQDLADRIARPNVQVIPSREKVIQYLLGNCKPEDAIVIAGARDDTLAEFAEKIAYSFC